MTFILLFLSIFNPNAEYQKELSNLTFTSEKIFQYEKSPQNKNKLKCNLAFEYQNQNRFKQSSKYLKNCKRLGSKYKELYYFMNIRTKFYLNNKNLLGSINYFLKTYPNSVFFKEVEKFKLRFYFKHNKYRSSYFGYINYKKDNKISHEELVFIDYIIRYSYFQIADKDNKLLARLDILKDKQFYTSKNIEDNIREISKYTIDDMKIFIKSSLKEKKYYKISKLLYLLRKFQKETFEILVKNKEIIKILQDKNTKLNFNINIYHFNKKSWSFEKREEFLDALVRVGGSTYSDSEKKDILYQKLVLYKRYKKVKKRIATYKKMLEFKQSRRKQSYYYLKIGAYSIDIGNEKEGEKYLLLLIKKFNRWYKEYPSALFTLFKLYRGRYLRLRKPQASDGKKVKAVMVAVIRQKLAQIEAKMEKSYRLKETSYYYKYKDKRATKEELKKIKEYFDLRPYNFYSIMINKKTIDTKNSWKEWKKFISYKEIPSPKINHNISKNYSIYQIKKIFKKHEDLFEDIKIIKNLLSIKEVNLEEKIMINFYNSLYKLNKLSKLSKKRREKKLNKLSDLEKENKEKKIKALKEIKKNYYYHFLNYFIAINNNQYSYLLMHRHFNHLKKDDIYKYYYHPLPYRESINKAAKKFNINPIVVLSIMETESIFNPNAYSSAGAIGLMQIMPATGRAIAKELKIKDYDLYLPKFNIEFGTYYIAELVKRFKYQLPFSAASYNGGPHNMKRWLNSNKSKKLKLDEMIENIGFRESRHYAKKIIRLFNTYSNIYFDKVYLIPVDVNYSDEKKIDF